MILYRAVLACLPGLLAVPLMAQPQIGGGTCSSSTLNGTYTSILTGRDLSSTVAFTSASQAIGTVTFDGLSKVTFTLTSNTNKLAGTAQTLAGTYSLQANCIGVLTITTGDNATFTLESYNSGKDYLMTGQDSVFTFTGNGSILPATCPTSLMTGTYSFNGSGYALSSGAIVGVYNVVGIVQFGALNSVSIIANNNTQTGTYTLTTGCLATAHFTDNNGINYVGTFVFTNSTGENSSFISSGPNTLFSGTARPL
jgi:hypothetical protein